MGFFDEYVDEGGSGLYIAGEEKLAIAQSGVPFEITEVIDDDENVYNGKVSPRFVLVLELPDPETGEPRERRLGFPKKSGVESRDKMLAQMYAFIEGNPEHDPIMVTLSKVGRAFIIKQAE
jgi:hypothetical protein